MTARIAAEEMMESGQRLALRLAYQGSRYSGWQRQPNAVTVQAVLEDALADLLQQRVAVVGAGRTDAGVHALGQWVHFDLPRPFPLKGLVLGANSTLPADVRVLGARSAQEGFHAQRSALWKRYRYRLSSVRVIDPLRAPLVAPNRGDLNVELVRQAIAEFEGRHDFSAFAKSGGSHDDPVREIYAATVEAAEQELVFEFRGNGFLRGMVRAMVGTLVEVGLGRRPPGSIAELLKPGRSRSESGPAAAAVGLSLVEVHYPIDAFGKHRFDGG